MNHNIEIEMSASINEIMVENIIRNAVEEQTGRTVQTITPTYNGTKFTGYSIIFVPDYPYTYKSSKEFVETKWK